ncbi:hypothetical protein NPIL_464451 [Nephila pilipes]|uniref:Uncharacterized protein n=1 Tax=Nephila pilipes TaxID=299642 RepID=A0A8X6N5G6_NEPPI|nr:hypothetical protein NPIL_464451 [Nephila pilipes]
MTRVLSKRGKVVAARQPLQRNELDYANSSLYSSCYSMTSTCRTLKTFRVKKSLAERSVSFFDTHHPQRLFSCKFGMQPSRARISISPYLVLIVGWARSPLTTCWLPQRAERMAQCGVGEVRREFFDQGPPRRKGHSNEPT